MTIKTMLSMDKYNTPSKLFVYFLKTYGNDAMHWKKTVNTCELVRYTLKSLFLCCLICVFGAIAIGMFICMPIIAVYTMLYYGVSYEILADMFPGLWAAFTVVSLCIIVSCILIGIYIAKEKIRDMKYKHQKEHPELYTNTEPTLFEQWYDAIKNKYCVEIDLDKISNS